MKDTVMQSALREWRRHMGTPMSLCIMAAIALILTIAGPFDTSLLLGPAARFGYWFAIIVCTYTAGLLVNLVIDEIYPRQKSRPLRILLAGTATGIAVTFVIFALNAVLLGFIPTFAQLPLFFGNIFVIAFVIALIFDVINDKLEPTTSAPERPSIIDRLPFEKRGVLMALSVEDHYVRILTSKGSDMVLLRLTDAIRETGDINGLQVHRSHWVALDAIAKAIRKGDGGVLTLTDGTEIPVSRSNMAHVKQAGLLAKSNG